MPSEHAEIERKYESIDGARVDLDAALGSVPSMTVDGAPVTTSLDATYFDTADFALLQRRIVLRRRTGGDDEGWHAKLPRSGDERREVRAPLGRATRTPPRALLDELRAFLRGRQLVPVARLRTERTERHLFAGDDTELAVVADDRVRAERLLDGASASASPSIE